MKKRKPKSREAVLGNRLNGLKHQVASANGAAKRTDRVVRTPSMPKLSFLEEETVCSYPRCECMNSPEDCIFKPENKRRLK